MIREDGTSTIQVAKVGKSVFARDDESNVSVEVSAPFVHLRVEGKTFTILESDAWTLRDVLGRAMMPAAEVVNG